MLGPMQQRPLLVSRLIGDVATGRGAREIVSRDPEGAFHRTTCAAVAARAKRIAHALDRLGVGPGERVATLGRNSHRRLELYDGVSGPIGLRQVSCDNRCIGHDIPLD